MSFDWSRFVKKIDINVPADAVYLAWTIPDVLEKWFLRKADFYYDTDKKRAKHEHVHSGDKYEWLWHGYGDDVKEKGEITTANGVDKLSFSFGEAGIVTVEIGKVLNKTIVMLTQSEIPTDELSQVNYHIGCQNGWTFYLANLKSYLETGHDLRNKNEALKHMLNS